MDTTIQKWITKSAACLLPLCIGQMKRFRNIHLNQIWIWIPISMYGYHNPEMDNKICCLSLTTLYRPNEEIPEYTPKPDLDMDTNIHVWIPQSRNGYQRPLPVSYHFV